MPSRIEPRASRASSARLCGSTLTFSWSTIIAGLAAIGPVSIRRKSNRWQRDATVNGILCGSVVASTNTTCAGGSSSVFSKALKASVVSMCASSMMYTLTLSEAGRYFTRSRRSRISSIPRLEAASISIRSTAAPVPTSTQAAHTPHGSAPDLFRQLMAFARILAVDVFPVPRTPENRYAWATRPCSTAFFNVLAIGSCPTRSANVCDRYLRYRVWYAIRKAPSILRKPRRRARSDSVPGTRRGQCQFATPAAEQRCFSGRCIPRPLQVGLRLGHLGRQRVDRFLHAVERLQLVGTDHVHGGVDVGEGGLQLLNADRCARCFLMDLPRLLAQQLGGCFDHIGRSRVQRRDLV